MSALSSLSHDVTILNSKISLVVTSDNKQAANSGAELAREKLRQDLELGWFTRKDNVMLDVKTKHMQQKILERYPEASNDYLLILMLLRVYRHSRPDTLERNFLLKGINSLWK